MTGQPETMHCTIAILAEVDLVQIGLENFILFVVRFQHQRHDGLVELARQGPFAAEIEVLYQLLGQSAAALDHATGPYIRQQRARDRQRCNTVVLVETAILDSNQRTRELRRHILQANQYAVLVMRGIETTNHDRVQPDQAQGTTGPGIDKFLHCTVGEREAKIV